MESKQLAYFLLACQQQNHRAAARQLGISASTLSQTLTDLENELGFKLFMTSGAGHHPTVDARLIYQDVDNAMRLLTSVGEMESCVVPRRISRVRSPLLFTLGRLSKAASLAALRTEALEPSCPTRPSSGVESSAGGLRLARRNVRSAVN